MFEKLLVRLLRIDCRKRNPIDYTKLLRSPGQSLDETMDGIRDKLLEKLFLGSVVLMVGFISILLFGLPKYLYIVLVLMYAYIFWSVFKYFPVFRNYKLGRDGEKSVAQYLSIIARQLSKEDANMHIYHDLQNREKSFNIDHVVVSKKGIFIFETKTYRKEEGVTNTIRSNGKELFRNGHKLTNNIPLQVKSQIKWLQSELLQKTGKRYTIFSAIVFVGWYVEGDKIGETYVTAAKTLKNILENQYREIQYDDEELKRITSVVHELATIKPEEVVDICG